MSKDEFQRKWSKFFSGTFAQFAFGEVEGPGLKDRLYAMMKDIERAVEQQFHDAQPAPHHNGTTTGTTHAKPR